MKIAIQQEDVDVADEVRRLRDENQNTGAVVTFSGLVRETDDERKVQSLTLEHDPGMTETSLLPKSAAAAGISFEELCLRILETAALENGDLMTGGGM